MSEKTIQPCIMIIAGGTGGHVMPALSVASILADQGWCIHWLGTQRGLEASLVPRHGFTLDYLNITGLRGKGLRFKILAPWRLLCATWQAWRVLKRIHPHIVLGMGGFVTGPGCVAAWLARIPIVIHEQNAIAGLTNRYVARIANCVCSSFPNVFPEKYHPVLTGNPVRHEIANLALPKERYLTHTGPIRLLVIGGSLGALVFNQTLPQALALMSAEGRPNVWHQTGEQHLATTRERYQQLNVSARIDAFIDDMAAAYDWADVILCRSGASTIAELSAVGIASLLVPFPYALDDHQRHNGAFLVKAGAAKMWVQTEFSPQSLLEWLSSVGQDRTLLLTMAEAGRRLAMQDAALKLARQCIAQVANTDTCEKRKGER